MRLGPLTALVVATSAWAAVPQKPLADLKQEYLDGLFRAKPHLATFMGDHRFDDRLVDLSPAALKAREAELVALEKRLQALGSYEHKVMLDENIDHAILTDGIGLELLYLREIKDWSWDPRLYDSFPFYDPREMVNERLSFIIHGTYAPEAERRKAVAAQLAALPKLIQQQKAQLEQPSKVHLEQAVKDNQGRIEVFESEIKEFTQADAMAESARVKAVAALRDYQSFLEKIPPEKATRDWRLGAVLYKKKFPLALQTRISTDDAASHARQAFDEARKELYEVSKRIVGKEAAKLAMKETLLRAKEVVSQDHPKPDELVQAHAGNLDRLRAFIVEHDLLTLPPKDSLSVKPMPLFKRGALAAEYLAPEVLSKQPTFHATYFVDPIDPTWKPEKVENYLRGQYNCAVELVAAHEAYPGHHTQFSYERHDLNPLRAVLWNGPMVEGWAVYGEGLLVKLGYGGAKNDCYRWDDAKGRMIVATNILIDIGLQSGTMSDEEAVRFMVEEGFQERMVAEKKLKRAKLDSTQLAQYFLGLDQIERLEADYRKKVGDQFKQRTFNEALIGHGSIAVEHLRAYLLGR